MKFYFSREVNVNNSNMLNKFAFLTSLFLNFLILISCAGNADPRLFGIFPVQRPSTPARFLISAPNGTTTSETGTSIQIQVVLSKQPSSSVRIETVSISDTNEGILSTSSLNFTQANWNTAQIITITGRDELFVDGDKKYTLNFSDPITSDSEFAAQRISPIEITNTDNDVPGINVTPTSGLVTSESGGTASFTVFLSSPPQANVTIPSIVSSNTSEGTVSPTTLSFNSTNWNIPQTVTVTGVDDAIDDGNQTYTISFGASVSTDSSYNNKTGSSVTVVNADNEVGSGFTLGAVVGNTSEAGTSVTFSVVLNTNPNADVTLQITSNDLTEGTVSPSSLTFTSANWNTAQVVTITGVNDLVQDGNITYTVSVGNVTSANSNYSSLASQTTNVTNNDNDTAGITINSTTPLLVSDGGQITSTLSVNLNSEPTANVVLSFTSSNTAEAVVSVSSLTFTPANWNAVQTVIVSGVNDGSADGNQAFTIQIPNPTTTDGLYAGIDPPDQNGNTCDNDTGTNIITACRVVNNPFTDEGGATAQYYIVLSQAPTSNVTVPIVSADTTEGTVSTASITLSAANWNQLLPSNLLTVTGVNDGLYDGDITYTINLNAATSADPVFNGFNPPDISLVNNDNEVYFTVSTLSGNTTEAGVTRFFSVVLPTAPTGNVVITMSSSNTAEAIITTSTTLTFTTVNWATPQNVTVQGVDDTIADGNQTFTIVLNAATSIDTRYNGRDPNDVTGTNVDVGEKRTFVTASTFNGNLGGVGGADTSCNTDANRPAITPNVYRALVSVTTTRTGNPLAGSWSFAANTAYFRADGTTPVFTSDAGSIFSFGTFTNSFNGGADEFWTGLTNTWAVGNNCTGWTTNSAGQQGRYGDSGEVGNNAISDGQISCNNTRRLLCVQQ
jgi:hypothetical protein